MSHDIIIDPTIFLTMQHFAKVQNHKTIFSLLIVDVIVLPTNKLLYRFFFAIFNFFVFSINESSILDGGPHVAQK